MKKFRLVLLLMLSLFPVVTQGEGFLITKPFDMQSWLDRLDFRVKQEQTISLIKKYEIFKSKPYKLGDYWYVGYGHLTIKLNCNLTEKEATEILRQDFNKNLAYFNENIPPKRRYLLALLSYNIGVGKVLKFKIYTQIDILTDLEFFELYQRYCFFNGKYHKGLHQRRLEELKIWGYEAKLDK